MPKHFLNRTQIRAVLQQMHRKTVAQRMRGNILIDLRLLLIILNDLPKALTAHSFPVHVYEQRRFVSACDDAGTDGFHILPQRFDSGRIQGDDALLIMTGTANEAHCQVNIVHVQPDQLGYADTGSIQQLQHGVIPESLFIHTFGLFQKQFYLFIGQDLRIFPFHLHCGNGLGRICFNGAIMH